jgi:MFS family permease
MRTLASVISRLFIGYLTSKWRNLSLLWTASALAGCASCSSRSVSQPWMLGVLLTVAGFCFGLTQPLTMSWVSTLADPANRAAVLSIRLAGNRLSQVAIPSAASALTDHRRIRDRVHDLRGAARARRGSDLAQPAREMVSRNTARRDGPIGNGR